MNKRETQRLIRRVVALAGDNQRRAAEALGVEQASVSRYVNGLSLPIPSVLRIAILIDDGTIAIDVP